MADYRNADYCNMLFFYGVAFGNVNEARRFNGDETVNENNTNGDKNNKLWVRNTI